MAVQSDQYGNPLSSRSAVACGHYRSGLDHLLAATVGMEPAFARAVAADEGFALAHLGLARSRRILGQGGDVAGPLRRAREAVESATAQERSLVHCLGLLLEGESTPAWKAIRSHLARYPRDALALQPTTGVFGLIGFSGRSDREREHLHWCEAMAGHFADDWWFLAQLGFARVESGDAETGLADIERSLALNPDNANAAHYLGHALYELGRHRQVDTRLTEWLAGYDPDGPMNCHLHWHLALTALYNGNPDRARRIWREHVTPAHAVGPPINVLTDGVSLLLRTGIAGHAVKPADWEELANYARAHFPDAGVSFADLHAAIAFAMVRDRDALCAMKALEAGPAADLVSAMAGAFEAYAAGDWLGVVEELTPLMADHARLGGSRAQRDLVEQILVAALARTGRDDVAARQLASRRPGVMTPYCIAGVTPTPGSATGAPVESGGPAVHPPAIPGKTV